MLRTLLDKMGDQVVSRIEDLIAMNSTFQLPPSPIERRQQHQQQVDQKHQDVDHFSTLVAFSSHQFQQQQQPPQQFGVPISGHGQLMRRSSEPIFTVSAMNHQQDEEQEEEEMEMVEDETTFGQTFGDSSFNVSMIDASQTNKSFSSSSSSSASSEAEADTKRFPFSFFSFFLL